MAKTKPNELEVLINSAKIVIFVKEGCPYCVKVKKIFDDLEMPYTQYDVETMENGSKVKTALLNRTRQRTVPNVFMNGIHVGGCSHVEELQDKGKLKAVYDKRCPIYDFDVLVMGGGSGGLATAREAVALKKRVAVIDYVEPTPMGTTWGLGGTCVNVGCIPKKLMHQAALLSHSISDAPYFGWTIADKTGELTGDKKNSLVARHNWQHLVENVTTYIRSLNWGYRVSLSEKNIVYINGKARFADENTVAVTDTKSVVHTFRADRVVIAIGCRPNYPSEVPGALDYGITSDDLFSLPEPPGKTLIVGASYIALECAGFLAGMGMEVTVMVRSILLRGFDRQMAEMIGTNLEKHGVKFVRECVVTSVAPKHEDQDGSYIVTGTTTNGEAYKDDFNTVMFAMGRSPCTEDIGLQQAGVDIHPTSHKIITNDMEQTSQVNIYAIGDVAHGRVELTPVAIQAGRLLVRRMFGEKYQLMDYTFVPTTVFTPLEYGCCGYSEEAATEKFGENAIEVYHNLFQPLEFALSKRDEGGSYAKLIALKADERVVGFHYIGPNAGEVTQGFALGLRLGATMSDFSNLVGIHPTCAEVFTTMRVTKSSGEPVTKTGC